MPLPTRNEMRPVDTLLTNFTVATTQEDASFVYRQLQKPTPVKARTGKYYTFDAGDWNRIEMERRSTGEQSAGSGWTLSTDSYTCDTFAVHKDVDWDDADELDGYEMQVDPRKDAAPWLANQIALKTDSLLASAVFVDTSVWTTNWDGVSSNPSTNQILQWNSSSSDPLNDIATLDAVFLPLIGRNANTMIVGSDVHAELLTNAAIRDAVKHTRFASLEDYESILSAYFGKKYVVAKSFQNSAKRGQTKSLAMIFDPDDVWVGYVAPNPGQKTMTAFQGFAWNGGNGMGSEGTRTYTFDIPERKVTRYEAELCIDIKIVSADAGAYIKDVVA